MRVLLLGGGAREHALAQALCRNSSVQLLTVAHNHNPGLAEISWRCLEHDEKDIDWIKELARQARVDLAVIGLEDPLDVGLPDALTAIGVPTVGPGREAAKVETSKLFTRELMKRYGIPGQVDYSYFTDPYALQRFLSSSDRQYALKPLGLTAGKGVKVMGDQLASTREAIDYGRAVIERKIGGASGVLVEERVTGEEFTLQTFVDGETVLPTPLVQDYKRAFEGDIGPNTGSMGSYSQPDGYLPFVTGEQRDESLDILRKVVSALRYEGTPYRGIMYGQFMMTQSDIKLVEINARFGDPEAINVLPLLSDDLLGICEAIVSGSLRDKSIHFQQKATVCKYVTPPGYPSAPRVGEPIRLDRQQIEALGVKVFFAKVDQRGPDYLTTTSRSMALLGIADSVAEAERSVEAALTYVSGEYHVRHDIGTRGLMEQSAGRLAAAPLSPKAVTAVNLSSSRL